MDATTVGRRLRAAERALGAELFGRMPGGALRPTPAVAAAVRAGLGRSILPRPIADGIPGLRRAAAPAGLPPPPRREIWLLAHPESRGFARVTAAIDGLEATVRARTVDPGLGTP